jgi:V/A-type H+-transporting ATPase subunit E
MPEGSAMTLEELKRQILERSAEEIQSAKERSEREAAAIKEEAEIRAGLIREKYLDDAMRAAEGDSSKMRYDAAYDLKKALNTERTRIYNSLFDKVREELDAVRDDDGYPALFQALLEEAVTAVGVDAIVLHVDPRDEELCSRIVGQIGLHCEIIPDLACAGGLSAGTPDGRVAVWNTLESRLERAKELLKQEVFSTLYG